MLSEQVHATLELSEPGSFAQLSEHLPMAWIEQALAATGTATVRRRRLPAEQGLAGHCAGALSAPIDSRFA